MDKIRTELVFILDRSGSMAGLEDDTVGGYNSMMEKQRDVDGEVTVTTVLFDDRYELLHDRVRMDELKPMSKQEYFVRGSTALIDAIGRTIVKIENAQKHIVEGRRANKVIFVIITDGYENASREFSATEVKRMVSKKRRSDKWEFIFLGANIDAVETAAGYGMSRSFSADYVADSYGFECVSKNIGDALCSMRKSKHSMPAASMDVLMKEIRDDHKKRGGKTTE